MYSKDEKRNMSYGECNKNASPLRVYANNKHFPKNDSFFQNFIYLTKRMTFMLKFAKQHG
jgi:hypothetical protein